MIKIDASAILPKKLGSYLLGIVPGMVFELMVGFGDPIAAHRALDHLQQVHPVPSYVLLLLFFGSSLIIGQTFYVLAWFSDMLIYLLYRSSRDVIFRLTLGSDWLYSAVGRLQGMPPKRNVRYIWRLIMWARGKRFPFKIRSVLRCQRTAATELLKRRYSIVPSKGQSDWVNEEWQAWFAVLGKAPAKLRESFLTARIFLSCGLAEYAALYLVQPCGIAIPPS